MKKYTKINGLTIIIFFCACSLATAMNAPVSKWGNLMDVAYKFSWYPQKDLRLLLKKKAREYGKNLDAYCGMLKEELTQGSMKNGLIDPKSFISGKDWKKYYRLAVAEFCLFLSDDNDIHLRNARTTLSVLSGKMELSNIAFWNYLFQSYRNLIKKDRDAFVASVFKLWQDVILKLEADDILMEGSRESKTELVRNIEYLYENLAHVIITRAIIEDAMPNLYPLGVIIISLKDKLKNENGYKDIVKSVAGRMNGLKSDNSNLNFAVALMEATANQYEFEESKSATSASSKYDSSKTYYELALSWADTSKGKAAILTQYMGLRTYIIRRLIDKDKLLSQNDVFKELPGQSNLLVRQALDLYDQLAQPSVQDGDFKIKGFKRRQNYIEAMHQLWDSSSKLLVMQSAYYKIVRRPDKAQDLYIAESPLLEYLSFFKKYVRNDSEIIPDNAFYTAAYCSKEMADLYRKASTFSTRIEVNNLAFDYQLRAIRLFPMDITGILQLAYQTNQEGRLNRYLQQTGPVASRFRNSKVAKIWSESLPDEYRKYTVIVKDLIPDTIDNAYFLVRFIQQSGRRDSEDELYDKAVVMTRLLMALKTGHSEKTVENVLSTIAKQKFTNREIKKILKKSLRKSLFDIADKIPGIETTYQISQLKNTLYSSLDNPVHSFLRELYYESAGR